MEEAKKQAELRKNFESMVSVTRADDQENHQRQMASRFVQMLETTKKIDSDESQKELARQFAEMMQTTHSFDSEKKKLEEASRAAISRAFQKMILLSKKLETENKLQMEFPPDVGIEKFPSAGDKLFATLINKLPRRIRRFPQAFRRNPRAVIKFFIAMVIGRILAITLYVIAAFIPALPIPESISGAVGKAPNFLGGALGSMRTVVTEFSAQSVMATVTNIPTDINKLLQKFGEFIQYYAQRTGRFIWLMIRHPRRAISEVCIFFREHAQLFLRMFKGAIGVAISFIAIKIAMVSLIPLFGGVAVVVAGVKISIIIVVIVRMAVSTLSEFVGRIIGGKCIRYAKLFYEKPEILWDAMQKNMEHWKKDWDTRQRK